MNNAKNLKDREYIRYERDTIRAVIHRLEKKGYIVSNNLRGAEADLTRVLNKLKTKGK